MSRRRAPQPSVPARPNGFEPGTTRAAERAPRARDAALHRASARQHALSRTRPAEYAKRRADGLDGDALSARRSWSSAEAAPPSPTSTATGISTSTLPTRACSPVTASRRWPAATAERAADGSQCRATQFNDLWAVERELARGDVACLLAEPALTDTGVVLPAEGFHSGLRRLASQSGALLAVDETHTLVAGPGGLTARWGSSRTCS